MTYADHLCVDAVQLHHQQFESLGEAGVWFTGEERLAIAQLAREAAANAGMFPSVNPAPDIDCFDDQSAVAAVTRRLATAPQTMERCHFQAALEEISCEQYVELVGIVARLMNIDIVRLGVALPLLPLPQPQSGEPSRQRPNAIGEGAWAPTVPSGEAGGEEAVAVYGSSADQPFIIRALSLVPDENRRHVELGPVQYVPMNRFHDLQYKRHEGLSRPQVELLAGRVSAINECFY